MMNNIILFGNKLGINLLVTPTLILYLFFISNRNGDNISSFTLILSGAIGKSFCSSCSSSGHSKFASKK